MRVCLISMEMFAWGKHGGFGRATRIIGRELAKRGVQVFAMVPRCADQRPVELLDGIIVLGFEPAASWRAAALLKSCWRARGEQARAYVRKTFELEFAIERHLTVYAELMAQRSR